MATIFNTELSKELIDGGKLQISRDRIPSELAEKVVPVMEVNPKLLRRINIIKEAGSVNTTSATIYTTPSDQDFYLCGIVLNVIKDVTATSTRTAVNATIGGAVTILNAIRGITLTVQDKTSNIAFPYPIKIDRGTNITLTHTTNVANVAGEAVVFGYISESSNA